MGTTPVFRVLQQTMKVLIILCVAALASCEADADALYSTYYRSAASLGYPYAYARGYAAVPVAAIRAAPVVPVAAVRAAPVAAPAVAPVAAVRAAAVAAPAAAEVRSAVPSVTSSQYHAQDEDKNFSF